MITVIAVIIAFFGWYLVGLIASGIGLHHTNCSVYGYPKPLDREDRLFGYGMALLGPLNILNVLLFLVLEKICNKEKIYWGIKL